MINTNIYVEFLSAPHLIRNIIPSLISAPGVRRLYIFDTTLSAFFLSMVLGFFLRFKVEKLSFEMTDIRDQQGTCVYLQVRYRDLGRLEELILQEFPIPGTLKNAEGNGRLESYLAKASVCSYDFEGYGKHSELWHALVLVGIVQWHRKEFTNPEDQASLYICERVFNKSLIRYALEFNLQVHLTGPFRLWYLFLKRIGSFFKKIEPSLIIYLLKHPKRLFPGKNSAPLVSKIDPALSRLMAEYWGQFNLDRPGCVSDFFFLQPNGIQGNDVCLVFNNRIDPVTPMKYNQMAQRGITAVARSIQSSLVDEKDVPVFHYNTKISCSQDCPQSWREYLTQYRNARDYWEKFFLTYNIKLWTTWFKYDASHMAMADAINAVGGISSVYQRSYESNPSPFLTVASDLIFGFSSRGYDLHRLCRSNFKYHITVGYIGDHRFKHLSLQAQGIRERLSKNGAQRIIAYFDENSVEDGRWIPTGYSMAQKNYQFWLEKIFEDKGLGIIFKPKIPGTLFKRLGPVADLLRKALKTGRCYAFGEGTIQGAFSPASAAMAADISIQESLWGGTAGIEAALAGSKTLLLDQIGSSTSPLYQLGPHVVFQDQEGLWNACQDHWKIPGGNPALGNWASMINEIDPFRDGRAAERMSWYLKELLEGLRCGGKPGDVMEKTAKEYSIRWGKDKVHYGGE